LWLRQDEKPKVYWSFCDFGIKKPKFLGFFEIPVVKSQDIALILG
jgi:hypothetical protein